MTWETSVHGGYSITNVTLPLLPASWNTNLRHPLATPPEWCPYSWGRMKPSSLCKLCALPHGRLYPYFALLETLTPPCPLQWHPELLQNLVLQKSLLSEMGHYEKDIDEKDIHKMYSLLILNHLETTKSNQNTMKLHESVGPPLNVALPKPCYSTYHNKIY